MAMCVSSTLLLATPPCLFGEGAPGSPLDPAVFHACAARPHIRVGVLYYRPPTMDPDNFEGGFVAAIEALQDPDTSPVGAYTVLRLSCACARWCAMSCGGVGCL